MLKYLSIINRYLKVNSLKIHFKIQNLYIHLKIVFKHYGIEVSLINLNNFFKVNQKRYNYYLLTYDFLIDFHW